MSITHDGSTETHWHARTIEFDGADPLVITGYSHTGKTWVPDSAHARWDHGKAIERINVSGNILKKDGTPGQLRYSQALNTPAHINWGKPYGKPAPAWLLELFGIEVPGTDPAPTPSTYSI